MIIIYGIPEAVTTDACVSKFAVGNAVFSMVVIYVDNRGRCKHHAIFHARAKKQRNVKANCNILVHIKYILGCKLICAKVLLTF